MLIRQTNPEHRQSGAALIVSLLILLVMTMLGLSSIQTSRMEERMSGNARDINLSFQAAEAALMDADRYLGDGSIKPAFDGSTPGLFAKAETGSQLYEAAGWNWYDSQKVRVYSEPALAGLNSQPRYYIEFLAQVAITGGSLVSGFNPKEQTVTYYRVTAYGTGASASSVTILQTVFAL